MLTSYLVVRKSYALFYAHQNHPDGGAVPKLQYKLLVPVELPFSFNVFSTLIGIQVLP
jgi:hypothetical protein